MDRETWKQSSQTFRSISVPDFLKNNDICTKLRQNRGNLGHMSITFSLCRTWLFSWVPFKIPGHDAYNLLCSDMASSEQAKRH
ncbi:hypothetical protein BGE01nite_31670 [Brevifollis gellanilyticus]|uniref:Uncharacterized protein n=1 Tax=Brevifollis gellanilyticus TaxID=748831 RepID=A0A512MAW3_9BACT|nr:hypothetical protein BGE01nite_31670 [Brevifollis gellanilyticus]